VIKCHLQRPEQSRLTRSRPSQWAIKGGIIRPNPAGLRGNMAKNAGLFHRSYLLIAHVNDPDQPALRHRTVVSRQQSAAKVGRTALESGTRAISFEIRPPTCFSGQGAVTFSSVFSFVKRLRFGSNSTFRSLDWGLK
jgi:hypothetical protein